VTSKSPGDAGESPTPKAPGGAKPDPVPVREAAREPAKRTDPEPAEGVATMGAAEGEPLPGRPPGQDLGMAPMDKSAGPTVVPPAQTNAATADLSRAETRPAGRAAPEPDAADEPRGGGDPGDVHPAVVKYEADLAKDEAKADKESKK
jgi:hypothetical protein